MKAFGHTKACPIDASDALVELDLPTPTPGPHDLLVRVRGISMNPVDVKVREFMAPKTDARVLGYDAAGVVTAIGDSVTRFAVGDEVYYAGDFTRPGTNAEFHTVDERIAGRKPTSLDFPTAAGMPLTSITAWEMLFDSMGIREGEGEGKTLLVIGGAGGVGSILIQLAKKLTKLTVVATASRADTVEWVRKMGADHVINHHGSMPEQLKELGIQPNYVASLTHTDMHFPAIQELIAPRGHIALIDDPATLDIVPLKLKALSVSWEFMFTRSMFHTADMDVQHQLLNRVADMLDDGTLQSTVTQNMGAMTLASLTSAHTLQESGRAIGKTVLSID
jgi:zinc-binding alcohol dehydrogenase family protein